MALCLPSIPKSPEPLVANNGRLWDANSWNHIQQRIAETKDDPRGLVSDEQLVFDMDMTSDELIDSLGLSEEEIERQFSQSREELANSLGMPRDDERTSN